MTKQHMDPVAAAQAEADTEASIPGMIKEFIVIANAARLIIMTLHASTKWGDSKLRIAGPAKMFLIFNAALVGLVTVYKFTSKMVRPLFFCQMLSHYSMFLIFVILWRYGDNKKLNDQRKHYKSTLTKMHFAYLAVLILGTKLCTCTEEHIYPISFVMGDGLFFVSYFLCNKLYEAGIKRLPGEEATMEDDMVVTFMSKYRFMAIWHAIELFLGFFLFEHIITDAVFCTDDGGNKW